jgi:hypothetical protein
MMVLDGLTIGVLAAAAVLICLGAMRWLQSLGSVVVVLVLVVLAVRLVVDMLESRGVSIGEVLVISILLLGWQGKRAGTWLLGLNHGGVTLALTALFLAVVVDWQPLDKLTGGILRKGYLIAATQRVLQFVREALPSVATPAQPKVSDDALQTTPCVSEPSMLSPGQAECTHIRESWGRKEEVCSSSCSGGGAGAVITSSK